MSEPSRILIEQDSPNQSLFAVVEDNGQAVYLHLVGRQGSGYPTRSLWIRNLGPAATRLEEGWQNAPHGPSLPINACRHPAGLPPLDTEKLSFVWYPEGDSVALLEGEQVLGVIPPWAGLEDCPGHARDCSSQTPIAWPIGPVANNAVLRTVDAARQLWEEWSPPHDPWTALRQQYLETIETGLGAPHAQYFAIDANRWPPKFLVRVETEEAHVLVTGGVSIRPQPQVRRQVHQPETVRRIEVAMALPRTMPLQDLEPLYQTLSRLASFPWRHNGWLTSGHTIPFPALPLGPHATPYVACVLQDTPPGAPDLDFPPVYGDPVCLLWLIPITDAEFQYAQSTGTQALTDALWRAGCTWIHQDRKSVF